MLENTSTLKKVVFDLDDTSWPLGETAAELSGIPYEKMVEFRVMENPLLSMKERIALSRVLHDPKTYRQMEFYPGFDKIMCLEEYGADLFIGSNSFEKIINNRKAQRVLEEVPVFPKEHMQFAVVNDDTTGQKPIGEDVYILVDDCPYTVARSRARYHIVPTKPWNQTEKALAMMRDKAYVQVSPGDMRRIYAIIRYLLL